MSDAGYLWIYHSPHYRWLWKDLARALSERTGLRPVLIVATEQDRTFYDDQFGEPFCGEIFVRRDLYGVAVDGNDGLSEDATLARCREIEDTYGFSVMRDMILADRHLGRAFQHNGSGHPMSRIAARATPLTRLQTCIASVNEIVELFHRCPPALFVAFVGGSGIQQKPISVLCRHHSVPIRNLCHTRFANQYVWAENEYEDCPRFTEFLRTFPIPHDEDVDDVQGRLQPIGYQAYYDANLQRDIRWSRILYLCGYEIARYMYGRLRGYRFTRHGYLPTANIGFFLRRRWHWKYLCRPDMKTMDDFEAARDRYRLVYYPLQMDPEGSIYGLSPGHNDQWATLRELALHLPADAVLVVKEHPLQWGRRPMAFYRWLKSVPNVMFLRPDLSGLEVTRRVDLVVTINSSAGYEAAAMGKPVIHFSSHGRLPAVPHVHHVRSFRDLSIIQEILNDRAPETEAQRRRDGARFYLALFEFGFDLGELDLQGRDRPSPDELATFCDRLLESLPRPLSGSTPAAPVAAEMAR